MNSINPLQTTHQDPYSQAGANFQNTRTGLTDPNVLHSLGLTANLLQNLSNDLSAVINGSNPERALNNLMVGLQQLLTSSNGGAKEWPAGKEMPEGGKSFVKGNDGQPKEVIPAKEWPAGQEIPECGKSFVKGNDGQPKEVFPAKEWPAGKEIPEGGESFVKGHNGQPKEVIPTKEWATGQAIPEGGKFFAKGDNDQPKAVISAKEWPAGQAIPEGGKSFVKGNDGQPKEFDASEARRRELENSNVTLQASADAVISSLKALLNAQATGGEMSQPAVNLRSALELLGDQFFANNAEQLRNALRNSINSQA